MVWMVSVFNVEMYCMWLLYLSTLKSMVFYLECCFGLSNPLLLK